jgi:hypothetical protein
MAKEMYRPAQIAAPAATGNAGPQFEAKVGAFYVLPLLSGGEPRGLPGATVRSVAFQQRVAEHPLDDVVVKAVNRDGSPSTLEIQVKRTLTFTASDAEFRDVVGQIWNAAKKPDFETSRYELAAAIARTTTRIEHACQEALHWARQLPDGATFAARINRPTFASNEMRGFVDVFRANLASERPLVRYHRSCRCKRSRGWRKGSGHDRCGARAAAWISFHGARLCASCL